MQKISEFLVNKRHLVLGVAIVIAIINVTFISKVHIITDLSELLPDDSQMRIGLDIMVDEFSNMETPGSVRVMSTDLPDDKKEELITELNSIEDVTSVDYEEDSELYNKDNHSLFVVNTDVQYGTDEFNNVMNTIETDFLEQYNLQETSGQQIVANVPPSIMLLSLIVMMGILFLMCASWLEPFLFLSAIGIAIVINMGTNIIFPNGVSETTYSIVAMLQLVLSMDYSIILTNRYRQEKATGKNKEEAMIDGIKGAFSSIASSSLTTVAGLMALVFMSFKIGPDMGLVLGKGVAISMVTILTVLPGLVLIFDKYIEKTEKKVLHVPMDRISAVSYKYRKVLVGVFVIFFASVFVLKNNMKINFLMPAYNEIDNIFPRINSIVVLYDNDDEDAVNGLTEILQNNEYVQDIYSYGTTLGKRMSANDMLEYMSTQGGDTNIALEQSMIDFMYYDYFKGDEVRTMTLPTFIQCIEKCVIAYPNLVSENDLGNLNTVDAFISKDELTKERSATELSSILNMDGVVINQVLHLSGRNTISIVDLLNFIQLNPLITNSIAHSSPEAVGQMKMLQQLINIIMNDVQLTSGELAEILTGFGATDINVNTLELVYKMYYSTFSMDDTWTINTYELLSYITVFVNDENYSSIFNDDKAQLNTVREGLEKGKEQLVGDEYSMLVIQSTLPEESDETNIQISDLVTMLDGNLANDYYLIGNSPMEYELTFTFDDELVKISAITALAIFFVVMLTFRNAAIPIILIALIQSAVYATMVVMSFSGDAMNFMALLIVQSILMGATTDYAILFTNYYRENRKIMNSQKALTVAYNSSIHTILTSGLIMVLVTLIVGYAFTDPSIRQICHVLSMGSAIAILLIIFVLPSIIATFDRITTNKNDIYK